MNPDPINRPEVIAELRAAFDRYEAALLAHDTVVLNDSFWASEQALRYGVTEHSLGIEAICRFRAEASPVHPGRLLSNTVINTFGNDAGCISTEFLAPDTKLIGRQTQTWVRIDGAWCIVAAHVSMVDPDLLKRYC